MDYNFLICGKRQVGKTYVANLLKVYFKYIPYKVEFDGKYENDLDEDDHLAACYGKMAFEGAEDSFNVDMDSYEYKTIYIINKGEEVHPKLKKQYDAVIVNSGNDKDILKQLIEAFKEDIEIHTWRDRYNGRY